MFICVSPCICVATYMISQVFVIKSSGKVDTENSVWGTTQVNVLNTKANDNVSRC